MKILVVDDEYVGLKRLEQLMSHYGDCDFATSGAQALDMIEDAKDDGETYDLVSLDIDMKGKSGIETLQSIADAGYLEKTKVVMVSMMSDSKTMNDAMDIGCTDYIVKPIMKDELDALMTKLGFRKK